MSWSEVRFVLVALALSALAAPITGGPTVLPLTGLEVDLPAVAGRTYTISSAWAVYPATDGSESVLAVDEISEWDGGARVAMTAVQMPAWLTHRSDCERVVWAGVWDTAYAEDSDGDGRSLSQDERDLFGTRVATGISRYFGGGGNALTLCHPAGAGTPALWLQRRTASDGTVQDALRGVARGPCPALIVRPRRGDIGPVPAGTRITNRRSAIVARS